MDIDARMKELQEVTEQLDKKISGARARVHIPQAGKPGRKGAPSPGRVELTALQKAKSRTQFAMLDLELKRAQDEE